MPTTAILQSLQQQSHFFKKALQLKHAEAREFVATANGFSSMHELQQRAKHAPLDPRVLGAVLHARAPRWMCTRKAFDQAKVNLERMTTLKDGEQLFLASRGCADISDLVPEPDFKDLVYDHFDYPTNVRKVLVVLRKSSDLDRIPEYLNVILPSNPIEIGFGVLDGELRIDDVDWNAATLQLTERNVPWSAFLLPPGWIVHFARRCRVVEFGAKSGSKNEYDERSYHVGVPVGANSSTQDLLRMLRVVEKMRAHVLYFLSISPHDVMARPEWPEIFSYIRTLNDDVRIRYLRSADEIDTMWDEMSVVKPPYSL